MSNPTSPIGFGEGAAINHLLTHISLLEAELAGIRDAVTAFVYNGCHSGDCTHQLDVQCRDQLNENLDTLETALSPDSTAAFRKRVEALEKVAAKARKVRAGRYPDRQGFPELEAALADLDRGKV